LAANLNLQPTTIGFDKASYNGVNIGQTKINLQAKQGVMSIAPFQTTVNSGTLDFAGQLDMRPSPMILSSASATPKVSNLELNDILGQSILPYVNPIFSDAGQLRGKLNLTCDQMVIPLSGQRKQDISILGTVSVSEMALASGGLLSEILKVAGQSTAQAMAIEPTKFRVQKGIVSYDNMQLDVGNNPVNFAGSIGFDQKLDMTVTLPWKLGGRAARVGEETKGTRIPVPLGGTIKKPELKLDKLISPDTIIESLPGLLDGLKKR
jgi:hypothetical protein